MADKEYLERIERIVADPSAEGLPAMAPIVALALWDFRPAEPGAPHNVELQSADVAAMVEGIAYVGHDVVAQTMAALGYRLIQRGDDGFRWTLNDLRLPLPPESTPPPETEKVVQMFEGVF